MATAFKAFPQGRDQQRRRVLRLLYAEGFFSALMVGTTETFALYFAVQRGLEGYALALASTLPLLLGSLVQWWIPCRVPATSLKRGLLCCVFVQLCGLLGLIGSFTLPFSISFIALLTLSLSLYWMGGLVAGPLWLDWITPWVPARRFTAFIARRNGLVSLSTLAAYVGGALWVHYHVHPWIALSLFIFSLAARITSFFLLAITPSSLALAPTPAENTAPPSILSSRPIFYILLFTVLFKLSVNLSAPFFLPYLVRDLQLSLLQYVGLTAIPFLGRYVALSNWGFAARTLRPFVGLQVSMVLIAINPLLWTLTRQVSTLSILELMSGIMWGVFDLCAVLVVQNFWPGNARRLLGMHMALCQAAALLGAWLGAQLQSLHWNFHDLFVTSSNLRFLVAVTFIYALWKLPETRLPLRTYGDFLSTILSVRPSLANVGRIIPRRRGQARKWIVENTRKQLRRLDL